MILTKLAICGFRGAMEPLELEIPTGFMVIAGRNGSGKSTICHAIEYALTGHFRTTGHKEKGESIDDYVWWRGQGTPKERFVALWLARPNGEEVHVIRTPDGVNITGANSIEEVVCDLSCAPTDAVSRLCRTSIIRDEEITQVSVDLPESERFDFVRLALATTDFSGYEDRAKAVHVLLNKRLEQVEFNYTAQRSRVTELTVRLSAMRSEASAAPEVGTAEEVARRLLNLSSASLGELFERASQAMATRRLQIENLVRLTDRVRSIEHRRQQIDGEPHRQEINVLAQQRLALQGEFAVIERRLVDIQQEIERQRKEQPQLTALASLHESGKRLGLHDGHSCPLCGSAIESQQFIAHLQMIQDRLTNDAAATLRSAQEHAQVQQQVVAMRGQLEAADAQLRQMQNASMQLDRELAEASSTAESLGVVGLSQPAKSSDLSRHVEELRTTYSELERSVALLETSRTLERITLLEGELEQAKANATSVQRSMEVVAEAVQQTKKAVDAIRRLRGEAIDDSLAELSPMMTELYLRLRPHVEWQDISYKLRGDVRKMLSFEVGKGLNPSFLFSSGQRRAAGLAFLLSVYLARPWCNLQTLILDDPVQHVDDFRALNLTEVLAAIRPLGRQIICTTEDSALAELMCRRLRSNARDPGCLAEMSYSSTKGIHVSSVRHILPMSRSVLIPA